jgi:GntR family transcriptional regulator
MIYTDEVGGMDIIISNSSNKPIYEQISSQIKDLILTGELNAGYQLPSIRSLAKGLRISAITTKRAYADLEAEGFIETVPGKGSFIARQSKELLREEGLRHIEGYLQQALEAARQADVSVADVHEMIDILSESRSDGRSSEDQGAL